MVKGSSSLNAIFRMNSLLPDSVYTLYTLNGEESHIMPSVEESHIMPHICMCSQPLYTTAGFHMEGGRYSLYHSRVSYGGGKVQPLPQQGFIRRG